MAQLVLDRFTVLRPCATGAGGCRLAGWVLRHLVLVAIGTLVRSVAECATERSGSPPGAHAAWLLAERTGSDRARARSCLARRGDPADNYRNVIAKSLAGRAAQLLSALRSRCAAAGARRTADARDAGAPDRTALRPVSRRGEKYSRRLGFRCLRSAAWPACPLPAAAVDALDARCAGYDSESHRQRLRERGVKPVIARRCTEHGSGLGKFRWVVEHTHAWLHDLRRLRIRFERRADIHETFLKLGCSLVCWDISIRTEQSFLKWSPRNFPYAASASVLQAFALWPRFQGRRRWHGDALAMQQAIRRGSTDAPARSVSSPPPADAKVLAAAGF
ncbi:hypothetical protein P3T22_000975 [Paraburkholderia sp. GAS348]